MRSVISKQLRNIKKTASFELAKIVGNEQNLLSFGSPEVELK